MIGESHSTSSAMTDLPTSPPDIYQITLLRHGQSAGNAGGIYQGQAEFDLTETGRQQAQALAGRCSKSGLGFGAGLRSHRRRCRIPA